MTETRVVALFAVTGLLMCALCACKGPKVSLALNPKEGDVWKVDVQCQGETRLSGGLNLEGKVLQEVSYTLTFAEAPAEGPMRVEVLYGPCELGETANNGQSSFVPFMMEDGENPLQKMVAALEGESLILTVDRTGEILGVDGANAIAEALRKEVEFKDLANGAPLSDDDKRTLMEDWLLWFSAESVKAKFVEILALYPVAPVRVGDAWQRVFTGAGGVTNLEQTRLVTLVGLDDARAKLTFTSTFKSTEPDRLTVAKGSGHGEAVIDRATGRLLEMTFDMSTDVTDSSGAKTARKGHTTVYVN